MAKFYRRRRKYGRRRTRKTGRVAKLERKVAKISKSIEHKFSDADFNLVLDWDGDVITLNTIALGYTDSTRVGDRALMTSVAMNINIERNNAGDFPTIRMILVWDKQNTIVTAGDVMMYSSGSPFSYLSMFVVDERSQFSVLHDKFYQLDSAGPNDRMIKIRKRLNKTTVYDGGTSTIVRGALKLIVFASTDSAAGNKAYLTAYSRVRYTDL